MKPALVLALLLTGCAAHIQRPIVTVPASPVTTCPATADICVRADQLPADATHDMFGPMRREYGSADIKVCSQLATAVTVPRAYIESHYTETSGIIVMPDTVAQSVIAHAQANTKTAKTLTYLITGAEIAAGFTQLSNLSQAWKSGLTDGAIGGAGLYNILKGAAASGSIIQYSAVALPAMLQFQAHGCVEGIVLDHSASGAPASGSVSFGVTLPK